MAEKAKTIGMKPKNSQDNRQKLTYEQLNDACNQLWQQNLQLKKKLQELDMIDLFKRLDYLFKVIEFSGTFKDADFVNNCIDEIKVALTPQKPEDSEEKKGE